MTEIETLLPPGSLEPYRARRKAEKEAKEQALTRQDAIAEIAGTHAQFAVRLQQIQREIAAFPKSFELVPDAYFRQEYEAAELCLGRAINAHQEMSKKAIEYARRLWVEILEKSGGSSA